MRILKNILLYVALVLVIIIAFAFAFIELRTLFAGDFKLFNNAVSGGFAYFFRGLYFLMIIALSVTIIIFNIKHKKICIILFAGALSLFVGALFTFLFYDYFVTLAILFINLILVGITSVGFFKKEQQVEEN